MYTFFIGMTREMYMFLQFNTQEGFLTAQPLKIQSLNEHDRWFCDSLRDKS